MAHWFSFRSFAQVRVFARSLPPHPCGPIPARVPSADLVDAGWLRDWAVSNESVGDALQARGDLPGALAAYRASLAVRQRLAAAAPLHIGRQRDLAVSHGLIGEVLDAWGDLAGALVAYRASLTIAERLTRTHPASADYQRDLAVSLYKLALVAEQGGCEREHRECLNRSVATFQAMTNAGMRLDASAKRVFASLKQRAL
jgi:tetratricopeptide (TPR) repeat protein